MTAENKVGKSERRGGRGNQRGNQAFLEYFHSRCALGKQKKKKKKFMKGCFISPLERKRKGTKRGTTTAA